MEHLTVVITMLVSVFGAGMLGMAVFVGLARARMSTKLVVLAIVAAVFISTNVLGTTEWITNIIDIVSNGYDVYGMSYGEIR